MDSYSNIYPLTNPLVLITSCFAVAGWLIAFIGACVAALHGIAWWIIIFELFFTVGIVVALGLGGFLPHRGMLLTLLAISFVYLTYIIPLIKADGTPGGRATMGGLIILIIMQGFWIFLLGISEESRLYPLFYGRNNVNIPNIPSSMRPSNFQSNYTTRNKENPLPPIGSSSPGEGEAGSYSTAKALHTYRANPQDPSELSFSKNEELEIIDRNGNWWKARKQDGSVGIVPSNYFSSA
ncbi:hypothetical protein LRAMOSA06557 [Lichtheimia ramosa]|uniref:SH3 domain-containing protein n=1 Tax=Lichtheimia ramosa TaxID=688394 RepID=A0A077X4W1_9FUNG|nr:hypothetical protein LRAMOSA06557 [Lichtheimia ramosa]